MNQREFNRFGYRWPQREAVIAVGLMLIGCLMFSTAWTQEAGGAKGASTAAGDDAKKAAAVKPATPPAAPIPLSDRSPFDVITLDEENKGEKLSVDYLQLPNRKLPINPPPDSKLVVRLSDRPDEEYEIAWRNIRKVDLFEDLLLAEGNRLVKETYEPADGRARTLDEKGKLLDEAFHYFYRVQQFNPNWPGLRESVNRYLFYDAGNLTGQKRLAEALSVLEELFRREPNYRHTPTSAPISEIMSRVLDRILNSYFEEKNYLGIRSLMKGMAEKYGNQKLTAVETWTTRLRQLASEKRDQGRDHLANRRYRNAFGALQEMQNLWPDIEHGKQLQIDIATAYPIAFVGVTQPAIDHDVQQIDNWPARRTGRLVHRTMVEFLGAGPEGGEYQLSLGSIEHGVDRDSVTFRLNQPTDGKAAITGYDVSRRILQLATPGSTDYSATWHSLLRNVRVKDVYTVEMQLWRPHVVPEAFLRVPLVPRAKDAPPADDGDGPFRVQARTEQEIQFANKSFVPGSRLAEIVEVRYDETQKALGALRRGEIDVLDRMFPADALRVRAESSESSAIRIEPYALPTVHMIVPNYENPFLESRDFRQALIAAINRDAILREELMGNREHPGFRVISGPFPASSGEADPLGYAYDEGISPMPHNALLAKTISLVAQKQVVETAKNRGEPEPKLSKLVFGFPGHEIARVACQAIAAQWKLIGLEVELREFPPGVTRDTKGDCDLVYKEIAIWEPVTDAMRILGPGGVAATESPYVQQSLRWLNMAQDWGEVRERLIDIHRAVFQDVAILPLWQTVEFFGYRKRLVNIGSSPVWLYQSVDQWRISLEGSAG